MFAGQLVGVKQIDVKIWLVSFMHFDFGFFDHETCRLESCKNPFAATDTQMFSALLLGMSTALAITGAE